ncbi:Ni/Fe hydrogenase [Clostridium botulinum]|uniref:hydrogenase small subunit n=1 Tax=Clostridium botulinum TaxID=1491 RepID=UPI000174EAFE|nr:hydrogenase small subunit [Clostridium botulinum]ACD51226.1 [Ni/Fe] hydrogenase, small subunit [Clostridium botulinum E3 str. Alaska E43]AJF29574.1 Ni/Fe hydrogenase [Clostridium botulinum]AJF32635.1 Ni/Fe hydrogenase [Clostridium botulinum]MBY6789279.1 hydrogenase small subunit [Clostridium botulinum]MBY6816961.1 hydrogenase small subunit [Clostridium botulinum]
MSINHKKSNNEVKDYMENVGCTRGDGKPFKFAKEMIDKATEEIKARNKEKINAIWLETSGCFGEVISLLNSEMPDLPFVLKNLVNMTFFGSICGDQGEKAYERILDTLNSDKEYILLVCGAIPINADGLYTVLATYQGRKITAMELVKQAAQKAKYIISIGTCACYGGPTAAMPNVSQALSVKEYLMRNDIINIPGCPANPVWTLGTVGYLINYGTIDLDEEGRPVAFYGKTIHEICPKRKFFDKGIFAKKLGDPECLYEIGCKGPITKVYCPISRWNQSDNWPIGDRTPCIGCARKGFPDAMEPFTKYEGGQ